MAELTSIQKNTYRKTKHWKERVKKVKERDNNRCILCGSDRRLVVHHLNSPGHSYTEDGIDDLRLVCNTDHRYLCHKRHVAPLQKIITNLLQEKR